MGPAELLPAAAAASTWWFATQLCGHLLNCWELVIPTFASLVYKGAASCACHLCSLAFPLCLHFFCLVNSPSCEALIE